MVFIIPGNVNRPEPTEEQVRALRETAATARRTVADSVEADRRHQQARRLIERWNLDREGLDQAAASLDVTPVRDEEICPQTGAAARWMSLERARDIAPRFPCRRSTHIQDIAPSWQVGSDLHLPCRRGLIT